MRLAWFSPLSPRRSGLAAYSAAILPALAPEAEIDVFADDWDASDRITVDRDTADPGAAGSPRADAATGLGRGVAVRPAHDFLWRQARRPYDLAVYQLAAAASHAWMWGYVVRHPGLAVLHDLALHAGRGAQLLRAGRRRHYRDELRYDRPDRDPGVAGIAGPATPQLLAAWPLVRPILATARRIAVHDAHAAEQLRRWYPGSRVAGNRVAGNRVDVLRFDVPETADAEPPPTAGRPLTFAAVPHTACVQQPRAILRALARVRRETPATLRLLGPPPDGVDIGAEMRAAGLDRETVRGPGAPDGGPSRGPDGGGGQAADVCICLGSLAAREATDAWLHCLAAGRATILSARARLADLPLLDPRTWRDLHGGADDGIAVAVDPRHESEGLWLAMRRLARDAAARRALGRRARAWSRSRRERAGGMIDDYRRVIREAAAALPGADPALPAHFRADGLELARGIAAEHGLGRDGFDLGGHGAAAP